MVLKMRIQQGCKGGSCFVFWSPFKKLYCFSSLSNLTLWGRMGSGSLSNNSSVICHCMLGQECFSHVNSFAFFHTKHYLLDRITLLPNIFQLCLEMQGQGPQHGPVWESTGDIAFTAKCDHLFPPFIYIFYGETNPQVSLPSCLTKTFFLLAVYEELLFSKIFGTLRYATVLRRPPLSSHSQFL